MIAANAVFVAVEFGMVAADRNRLEQLAEGGTRGARGALAALHRLSFSLSGAQLGISLVSLTLGFLIEPALAPLFETLLGSVTSEGARRAVSAVLALAIATVAQMVLGELVPKNLAIASPERASISLNRFIRAFCFVCSPLIRALNATADAIVRVLGMEPRDELSQVRTLPEMAALFRASAEEGTIAGPASRLLARTVRFGEKTAADALVPRVQIQAVPGDATVDELVAIACRTGFSRLPVLGADLDDIAGVVHVKAVHAVPVDQRATTEVRALMNDAVIVPETRPLADILREMRGQRNHLVVVVDEYGGTAGILTLEDVIEEIVGDIADEHDPGARVSWTIAPGEHLVPAALHPDEVEEATTFAFPEGAYETLAGFVLDRLGHVPKPGEHFTFDGWRVEVLEMDRHRIVTVRLTAPPVARSTESDRQGEAG